MLEKADIPPRFDAAPSHHAPIVEEIIRISMPPNEELVDLIETAFLDGVIDGETQALAFAWLERNHPGTH